MDFSAIRSRLAGSGGRLYWRSLGELADTPEVRKYLHREFPEQASEWNDPKGRREFLKVMSASIPLGGVAQPVLVESHMGRPTKIEGNPEHPASLGATDIFGQAAVLGLYDPDRSQTLTYRTEVRPWSDLVVALRTAAAAQRPRRGAGLRVLTQTVTSPTLAAQMQGLL